jgi:hypothetical protein
VLFTFHTITPHGSRVLSVKGTYPVESTAERALLAFEDEPRSILTVANDQVAVSFTPPEDIQVCSTGIVMRRHGSVNL